MADAPPNTLLLQSLGDAYETIATLIEKNKLNKLQSDFAKKAATAKLQRAQRTNAFLTATSYSANTALAQSAEGKDAITFAAKAAATVAKYSLTEQGNAEERNNAQNTIAGLLEAAQQVEAAAVQTHLGSTQTTAGLFGSPRQHSNSTADTERTDVATPSLKG